MLNQSTANPPEPERGGRKSERERRRELECPVVFNKLHAICSSSNCSSSSSSSNLQHAALPLNLWQTGSCAELSLQSQMAMTTWAAGGGVRKRGERERRRGREAEEEGQNYCKKTNALAHEMQLMPHRKVVHVHVHLSASNMPHATHAPQEMWICHIEIQFDLSDDI